ncbi:rho guanine nucleotide exchange factor 12 isoform X4 [Diprion similis]|uniref:rho guanine nucleotide exchange factor 12 isoform X4 n=1 Tax=Diprion similis TaxID=362088 RepID=UPI001EF9156C|nr:rho guanine nucleotide exchange factor 12 isoform X4 [Diprion similis]
MNGSGGPRRSAAAAGGNGSGVGEPPPIATLVVYKDVAGYGMKVSGDNPVYVQSVKEGGAAARAGLHSGDKIIKVNGVNVMQSTHTDVVALIKSSTQVVLTVQQKPATGLQSPLTAHQIQRPVSLSGSGTGMVSLPSPPTSTALHRAWTAPAPCGAAPSTARITGPQPVDHEKLRQLETQRVNTFQQMLETEQQYLQMLRDNLAKAGAGGGGENNVATWQTELVGAERRVRTLQDQLTAITNNGQFSQGANLGSAALNKHQRTKSSPEQLGTANLPCLSPAEASRRLIASESMNDLSRSKFGRHSGIDLDDPPHITPPGTPPPPYPQSSGSASDHGSSTINDSMGESFVTVSPVRQAVLNEGSPGLPPIQQPIMSMEDDDMSDQEVGQLEDHGPFKSLSRLWEHHAHLAVFINYVLSNSDPSSLLFYLITDLYKEGNAKEMRKWAYEIHSSFLVPGAPLRLNNVDENVAREIDDVLLKESDKEEILRKIFWKARARAKEELNEQLADFQQKRTAGLGTLFGPSDAQLDESTNDKAREAQVIDTFLLPKMEPYLDDTEKERDESRELTTAAGLATILTKIFQVRVATLDRFPTFVSKDKSNFKARLLTGKTRKLTVRGHHFVVHQYYTVTYCNHCQLIIWGVGPQGYQCSDCSLNVHRQCVHVVDENCPGPLVVRKEKGDRISKFIGIIRPERKPPSSHHHLSQHFSHNLDRIKKSEDDSGVLTDGENGDHRAGGFGTGSAGGNSERGRGSSGYGTGAEHAESMDDPSSREDIAEMLQQNIPSKPKTSTINRSESYKEQRIHQKRQREKRKTSDPNLSKTKAGFSDCEATGTFPGNSAGSSSTSSLSTRSLDSLNTSLEHVHPVATSANTTASWDSDVDVEADPPDWSQGVAEDVLARLTNSEKKRQEVINELFHTERSHVRALKVLSQVFHKPMVESQVLPQDQILLLFSNLDEMLDIHSGFNQAMKNKKKENPCVGDVGDLLLGMFDGPAGEAFERAASTYCAKQQVALDALRDRRKKDPKLHAFLNEVEANPLCRRLQLKDHILTGMLRLTKYPLLFENLAKYTPASNEKEKAAVLRSLERSKEVLNQVNQAVRVAEDYHRLAEIQRTMDRSAFDKFDHSTVNEFRNLDITKRKLIYEGPLQWRMVNRAKPVDLHVVLLDDTILLLHRQDEKYLLKFINTNQVNSVLSPIVKVSTVLVRHNAVDKNSLYLVNTSQSGAQIYELVANSPAERKLWFKHITEACEAFKTRDREGRRPPHPVPPVEEPSPLVQDTSTVENEANSSKGDQEEPQPEEVTPEEPATNVEHRDEEENSNAPVEVPTETEKLDQPDEPEQERQTETTEQPQQADRDSVNTIVTIGACGDPLRLVTCTQSSLIEPDEVRVEVRPIHLAEPVLTPIESLRRKDALIRDALMEKQALVADILNVPREDFEHLADMASEPSGIQKEPTELILAAVSQANQLMEMLNSALNVTETETVLASRGASISAVGSCESPGCPAPRPHSLSHHPSIPVASLQPVCISLASQLSQLLEIVKDREEERERMRRELRRSREKLHAIDADAQRRGVLQNLNTSTHTQTDPSESLNGEGFVELNLDEFVDAFSDPEPDLDSTQALGEHRLTEIDVEENPHGVGDSVG